MQNILLNSLLLFVLSTITCLAEPTHAANGASVSTKAIEYENFFINDLSFDDAVSDIKSRPIFYDIDLPSATNNKRFKLISAKTDIGKNEYYVQIYEILNDKPTYGIEISTHYDGELSLDRTRPDLDKVIESMPVKDHVKNSLKQNTKLIPDRN